VAQVEIPLDDVITRLSGLYSEAVAQNTKLSVALDNALGRIDVLDAAVGERDEQIVALMRETTTEGGEPTTALEER
jgi:hypothetical protein